MSRRLVDLSLDNLEELPHDCRRCVYWELDPIAGDLARADGDTELEKEAWLSDTLLEWGSCGKLAFVGSLPAGFVLFAPAAYVPRAAPFPTSPVSPDAVLLMTARVLPAFAGTGLGRTLVQAVARDVMRRGIRAVEAFGHEPGGVGHRCVLPAGYLRSVGFRTVRPHPLHPRLRLDVRSTVSWREDMESTVEKWWATVRPPALGRA